MHSRLIVAFSLALIPLIVCLTGSGSEPSSAFGTEMSGKRFGENLVGVRREVVEAHQGKSVDSQVEDSITVIVVGTLRTGIFAIGGETTGTTITANDITWELDFGDNAEFRKTAEALDGKKASVKGSLERRRGVEIKERWIVTVSEFQAAGD